MGHKSEHQSRKSNTNTIRKQRTTPNRRKKYRNIESALYRRPANNENQETIGIGNSDRINRRNTQQPGTYKYQQTESKRRQESVDTYGKQE